VTVTGAIKTTAGKHKRGARPKTKTFRVRRTVVRVRAGKTVIVAVKLPGAALRLLRNGYKETAALTLTATVPHGSSTIELTISNLRPRRRS
jgi:hypothetical protein